MWETPPRSPTMVGIAVDTVVWSRAAMSMPARSAEKMRLTRRLVKTIGGAVRSVGGACKRALLGGGLYVASSGDPPELARGGEDEVLSVRGREPGLEGVPRLVDEGGERSGEVGGEPAMQRGAHHGRSDRGQQGGVDVGADLRAGALGDRRRQRALRLAEPGREPRQEGGVRVDDLQPQRPQLRVLR